MKDTKERHQRNRKNGNNKVGNKQNTRNGKNNNRSDKQNNRKGNNKKERDIEDIRDIEMDQIEDALVDQTTRIIEQLMEVITSRLKNKEYSNADSVDRSRSQHYKDNSTYERLYGNENYNHNKNNHHENQEDPDNHRNHNENYYEQQYNNKTNERGVRSNRDNYQSNQNYQGNNSQFSQNETSNVSMNIQRPRNLPEQTQEPANMILPGGAQLYPGQQYNQRSRANQMMGQRNVRPSQSYSAVQNTYQPTIGPGGRAEAPRDNVVIGSQALQYASRVANRVGSSEISMGSGRNAIPNRPVQRPVQMTPSRAPVANSMPVARPAAPAMRSGPAVAQAA